VEEDLAREIAGAVQVNFVAVPDSATLRRYSADPEAQDLRRRAISFASARTKESILKAIDLYQQAIRLDSGFALAWSGLSDAYSVAATQRYLPRQRHSNTRKRPRWKA